MKSQVTNRIKLTTHSAAMILSDSLNSVNSQCFCYVQGKLYCSSEGNCSKDKAVLTNWTLKYFYSLHAICRLRSFKLVISISEICISYTVISLCPHCFILDRLIIYGLTSMGAKMPPVSNMVIMMEKLVPGKLLFDTVTAPTDWM